MLRVASKSARQQGHHSTIMRRRSATAASGRNARAARGVRVATATARGRDVGLTRSVRAEEVVHHQVPEVAGVGVPHENVHARVVSPDEIRRHLPCTALL